MFVRWDGVCFALVCLLLVSSAGCGGRRELGQGRGGAGGDQVQRPVEDSDPESEHPEFYTVAAYDVDRDPDADLSMTISKAQQQQKRILLQVGGDWCNWCGRLAEFMRKRERVRTLLDQHFLIMKVASQSKHADAFLADYPKINAYPFVYVLSPAGELLHAQDMEELELGEGYNEEAFVEFLVDWGASGGDGKPDDLEINGPLK